jgi:hypothetical protein
MSWIQAILASEGIETRLSERFSRFGHSGWEIYVFEEDLQTARKIVSDNDPMGKR